MLIPFLLDVCFLDQESSGEGRDLETFNMPPPIWLGDDIEGTRCPLVLPRAMAREMCRKNAILEDGPSFSVSRKLLLALVGG